LAFVVVDIFDRYDIQNSIKKAERDRLSKSVFTAKSYEMIEGRVIPDWKKFISSGENKQSLIRFLSDYIVKHINQNSSLQEGQCQKYCFINVWRKSVFDIYFTEFGTALTTILPILFQYCYKYCYSDSRNLWAVMKGGGLAL
jgi:hypothetical protein